jgi:hypothetical protein
MDEKGVPKSGQPKKKKNEMVDGRLLRSQKLSVYCEIYAKTITIMP